jgi:hypothetical protein
MVIQRAGGEKMVSTYSKSLMLVMVFLLGVSTNFAARAYLLTFEGLKDLEYVNGFYGGGSGSFGSVGPNYGLTFSTDTFGAAVDADAPGGAADFENEPSPSTTGEMRSIFNTLSSATGFTHVFGFYYSSPNVNLTPKFVSIYADSSKANCLAGFCKDGILLPVTPSYSGPGSPFNVFKPVLYAFSGTSTYVEFGGPSFQMLIDNMVVPLPSSLALLMFGFLILRGLRSRYSCDPSYNS